MGYDRKKETAKTITSVRYIYLFAALFLLAACTGSSKKSVERIESRDLVLTGSVGDGPIVGADITIEDANGKIVFNGKSDDTANYQMEIPDGTRLPVIVRVNGGTDLVTGRAADFELLAVAFESGTLTANASPYTTLAVRTAQCMGKLSPDTVAAAWDLIDSALNVGWNRESVADPMREVINDHNVGTILVGNEALAEVIRRTSAVLAATDTPRDNDQVIELLACDLADGQLDGRGQGTTPRATLIALATATAVRLEVIAGELQVGGTNVTSRLQDALNIILPAHTSDVSDVPVNQAMIEQTLSSLGLLLNAPIPELFTVALALDSATPNTARGQITPVMNSALTNTLAGLGEVFALADETIVRELMASQVAQSTPAPIVSFNASETQLTSDTGTQLSWASVGAEICYASGGWSGKMNASGTMRTQNLTSATEFVLTCAGSGGVVSERVFVDVGQSSTRAEALPAISLSADRSTLESGDSANLVWSATNAATCKASGDWSGAKSVAGSLRVGPLNGDADFGLTCTGYGGSQSASISIEVTQPISVVPAPDNPAESATQPTLTFNASQKIVNSGESVNLTWSAANARDCTASGGWTGTMAASGSMVVGPIDSATTFTLSCRGTAGNVMKMLKVSTVAPVTLRWEAPKKNVDGTNLTDLAGYRIYYGTEPRVYADPVQVMNPATTSHTLNLVSGDYYLAMTALDQEGNESGYSNEVVRTSP